MIRKQEREIRARFRSVDVKTAETFIASPTGRSAACFGAALISQRKPNTRCPELGHELTGNSEASVSLGRSVRLSGTKRMFCRATASAMASAARRKADEFRNRQIRLQFIA
jgi:hypothetical protein